ncbi:MAG: hypothetical protein MJZ36_02405 [Bacteroidaceae bacterium]|nr:hypothetical protein [Bacteroidaceae bacterium]
MEEKKISEKESLELISQMIQQTKKDSAIGNGNMFLVWGYLCTFMSLAVFAMSQIRQESGWGWLYMAIPVVGFIAAGIVARSMKKKYNTPSTYASSSIGKVWFCLSFVFVFYAVYCFAYWNEPQGWTGMFLLGLFLPSIGTYCTGAILNEDWVQWCGIMGTTIGCKFLHEVCCDGMHIELKWCILMAFAMIISLVIPGHILNYKAKKANAK